MVDERSESLAGRQGSVASAGSSIRSEGSGTGRGGKSLEWVKGVVERGMGNRD